MSCLLYVLRNAGWWLLEAMAPVLTVVALYGLAEHACLWLLGYTCTGGV